MEQLLKEGNVPLRILLMGDASNFHSALAAGLRRLGHDVVLASDGSAWMNTSRDVDLSRPLPGKLGGLALWLILLRHFNGVFTGYDVVSLCGLSFVKLRPARQRYIFDLLKKQNGSVFYTALGTD
ncbi:MAG: glycosyltransferase family 1 protein, partial [Muribaculaceae bacterium]|nr:glycosyltransferase family 1 protein [Muribaculaceae bacterium]